MAQPDPSKRGCQFGGMNRSGGVDSVATTKSGPRRANVRAHGTGTEVQVQTQPTALERIIADNDPRNGSIANRLIRMLDHPERQPDSDGLYRDELSSEDNR